MGVWLILMSQKTGWKVTNQTKLWRKKNSWSKPPCKLYSSVSSGGRGSKTSLFCCPRWTNASFRHSTGLGRPGDPGQQLCNVLMRVTLMRMRSCHLLPRAPFLFHCEIREFRSWLQLRGTANKLLLPSPSYATHTLHMQIHQHKPVSPHGRHGNGGR